MVVATLARTGIGTLAIGGPMAPLRPRGSEATDGATSPLIDTGYPCRVEAATGALLLSGPPAGMVSVGGYRFALQELHDVVARLTPEAVLAALPDLLTGHKLAGSGRDPDATGRTLAEEGTNPLVSSAFRERRIDTVTPGST
jgi:hypothetical protein